LFEITVPLGVIRYYRENLKTLMTPEPVKIPTAWKRPAIGASSTGSLTASRW
jgi:hypothetical protein